MLDFSPPPSIPGYAYGSFTALGPVAALGSKLKAWWDADDHGTANMIDDGAGAISAWIDKVGAMALAAITTQRPTWGAASFLSPTGNHKAGLAFNGTANFMASLLLGTLPTGATAGELWALVDHYNASAAARIAFGYGSATGPNSRFLFRNAVSSVLRLHVNDGTTSTIDTQLTLYGAHALSGAWAATVQTGSIDGLPVGPTTITTINTSSTKFCIGARSLTVPDLFWLGQIRHAMVTTTLTALERQQLAAWLLWDVGWHRNRLPFNHPFRFRRP